MDSDLCSHTGFLVAAATALASHARLWVPRLAPVSGAPLSSALNTRSRKQRGKKKSLASSAAADFSPDSLQASRGALNPCRLCSRSQTQSSPCAPTKARASAPSPTHPGGGEDKPLGLVSASRHRSSVRESLHFAPRTPVAVLSPVAPKVSPSTTHSLCPRRGFLVCGNLSSFTAPSHWCRSRSYPFVSVYSFFLCPTQVRGGFLAFWEV